MTKQEVHSKIFWTLLIASVFAAFASIPYTMAPGGGSSLALGLPFMMVAQLLVFAAVYAVLVQVGLLLSKPAGLGTPALQKLIEGKPLKNVFAPFFTESVLYGFVTAVSVLILELVFFLAFDIRVIQSATDIGLADRFFALFTGAINDEIFFRLFFMSLVAWGLVKILGEKALSRAQMTGVVAFVAIVDAATHLPSVFAVLEPSPMLVVRMLVVGALSATVFGVMYVRHGILSAMLTHFAFEFSLFILLPAIVAIS